MRGQARGTSDAARLTVSGRKGNAPRVTHCGSGALTGHVDRANSVQALHRGVEGLGRHIGAHHDVELMVDIDAVIDSEGRAAGGGEGHGVVGVAAHGVLTHSHSAGRSGHGGQPDTVSALEEVVQLVHCSARSHFHFALAVHDTRMGAGHDVGLGDVHLRGSVGASHVGINGQGCAGRVDSSHGDLLVSYTDLGPTREQMRD